MQDLRSILHVYFSGCFVCCSLVFSKKIAKKFKYILRCEKLFLFSLALKHAQIEHINRKGNVQITFY